jgi:hypothetical protein
LAYIELTFFRGDLENRYRLPSGFIIRPGEGIAGQDDGRIALCFDHNRDVRTVGDGKLALSIEQEDFN